MRSNLARSSTTEDDQRFDSAPVAARSDLPIVNVGRPMIRPYRDTDLDTVLDVWYRASVIAHAFLPGEFFERERRLLAERFLPMSETIVYETEGRVFGFLSMFGSEVGGIFVDPEHQRQGIGTSLLNAVSRDRAVLEVDVFEANSAGRRFYEAYGFEPAGTHLEEDTGEPEIHLRFERHT
jgi:putative acetyltransferase